MELQSYRGRCSGVYTVDFSRAKWNVGWLQLICEIFAFISDSRYNYDFHQEGFCFKVNHLFLHFSVLAYVLPASCLAPIDLLQQSGTQQTNGNSDENGGLDPYDVNEELMDKGVVLDDIGKE